MKSGLCVTQPCSPVSADTPTPSVSPPLLKKLKKQQLHPLFFTDFDLAIAHFTLLPPPCPSLLPCLSSGRSQGLVFV